MVAGFNDDGEVERAAKALQAALKDGDAYAVADMVDYPVHVVLGKRTVKITNVREFVKQFDTIFDKSSRRAICDAVPHAMFAKWSGVMLGETGEIWFVPRVRDSKVVVSQINNDLQLRRNATEGQRDVTSSASRR